MLRPNKTKIITFILLLVITFIIGGAKNFGADWLIIKIWPLLDLLPYLYHKIFPQSTNIPLYFILSISWLYILSCIIEILIRKFKK